MPARGYIDLTLTKKVSSSADSYGYYYLKIYGNSKYCLDTRTLSTRDRSEDLFTVGLDQGSYLITLEQKGMYTNYFPVTASLTLDITEDDFFETEENNTKASATPIATNAMYNAIFGEEYECVDWYSFNVLAGEKYRIRMKNIGKLGSTTALYSLSDSSGKETSFGYTLKKQETENYNFYDFSPAQSGTYTVKIYNYHRKDALIPYQIGVYREIDLDSLNTLEFPESLLVIEDEAFAGGTFEAAIIPDGCISIGSRAFADCPNLVFVHIPKTVKAIAGDAFDGCGDVIIDR